MADYQSIVTSFPLIIRNSDGAVIPNVVTDPDRIAYNAWLMDGNLPDTSPVTTPPVIAKVQFYQALAAAAVITENQAIQAMDGNLPNVIDSMINALPAAQRFRAKMFFRADRMLRRDALINALQAATGQNMDQLFRNAEKLSP